eukprot:1180365-Prorocentrum_minimum.AAC.3
MAPALVNAATAVAPPAPKRRREESVCATPQSSSGGCEVTDHSANGDDDQVGGGEGDEEGCIKYGVVIEADEAARGEGVGDAESQLHLRHCVMEFFSHLSVLSRKKMAEEYITASSARHA